MLLPENQVVSQNCHQIRQAGRLLPGLRLPCRHCNPVDLEHVSRFFKQGLAKKTLKGEAKNYLIELAKRATREVCFSELCESELNRLYVLDEYESDFIRFQVSGYDVFVRNALLGEALETLSERKRNIVLLSYFLDMSDAEIGQLLNVVRSTVFRHRKAALAKIKQYMEGKADENQ